MGKRTSWHSGLSPQTGFVRMPLEPTLFAFGKTACEDGNRDQYGTASLHAMFSYVNISLKPQDSFGKFDTFFLIFRKCRKSSENTIRPTCNCLELHIVMQFCPIANYHYVHNLWQSVRGNSEHFYVLVISWKWKHFGANWNRALIAHTNLWNSALSNNFFSSFSPSTKTIHWL